MHAPLFISQELHKVMIFHQSNHFQFLLAILPRVEIITDKIWKRYLHYGIFLKIKLCAQIRISVKQKKYVFQIILDLCNETNHYPRHVWIHYTFENIYIVKPISNFLYTNFQVRATVTNKRGISLNKHKFCGYMWH